MISQHKLEQLLSSLAGSAQRGTFFRSIDLHWLLQGTPLSAIGSRMRGGRYNRKGAFEAFYIANTQQTALYETEAIFKVAGIVVASAGSSKAATHGHFKIGQWPPSCPDGVLRLARVCCARGETSAPASGEA